MIDIPDDFYYKNVLETGTVLYFITNKIDSEEPHPHIVIHSTKDEVLILGVTTSQVDKRREYAERNGIDLSTIVHFYPGQKNGLTKESVVDCNNSIYAFSKEEFIRTYTKDRFKVKGKINEAKLEELKTGILHSKSIEKKIQYLLDE
ncbi:MAG: hypothetical protein K9I68_04065 [Bacteroidales bacterium]|nr:hypothetical protein [Bacteroidales bacterium]MCF8336778.1 hypothetical protein [Bacteroidales bacterium]